MNLRIRGKWIGILLAVVLWAAVSASGGEAEASGVTRIHFISLNSGTDAILLESNGHYGMVDSGEDWDYPDGEEYPLRSGVTQGIGYEQQVIHYLEELGVEHLDFYIATHAHSDHIGSGDEILRRFPTDRLYIQEYSDAYLYGGHISDPEDPYYAVGADDSRLWDNQYVYDRLIEAAKEQGTEIITDLDDPANAQRLTFSMGDMEIEILNNDRERDSNGTVIPVPDDNCNALVTKVTAYGRVALLTSDLDPTVTDTDGYSDTVKVVQHLISQLWTEDTDTTGSEEIQVPEDYEPIIYEEWNGVTLSTPAEGEYLVGEDPYAEPAVQIDESKVNTGKTISIDLMKMSHHSSDYNNTTYFLTSLNPKTVVITCYEELYNDRERSCLPNAEVFATATDSAAVVATFTEEGVHTEYTKMEPGWQEMDGKDYYFDENGRTYTDSGIHEIDGEEYCFDQKGAVETSSRWAFDGNIWKYWKSEGYFATSEWIEDDGKLYYCGADGRMVTGWNWIDKACYYFDSTGAMQSDAWINGHYVDKNGRWISMYSTARWMQSGSRWWYQYGNGSYSASKWENIDGARYYFDAFGWMTIGWKKIDGKWYYFADSGKLQTDTWVGNCYVDASGAWDMAYTENLWMQTNGRWWYRHEDGSYTASGWEYIDDNWYYFDASGWMVTGWQQVGGNWYYFNSSGAMAVDAWIGSCYVDASGKWDEGRKPSQWMQTNGRWWYRHEDGSYTTSNWECIGGKWYYFDASGWMTTGWQQADGNWYYLNASGVMAASQWVGNYFLKADGSMSRSEWVDGGKYYVDENGLWVQNY